MRFLCDEMLLRLGRWLRAGESLDQAADHLRQALAVDWLRAPFTRCLIDNEPLDDAGPDDLARVPERSRATARGMLRRCPACGRLYWPGGHFRRMHDRLARWRDASAPR